MAQYIDKSAIVAEIDRRIEAHRNLEHWNAKHEFLKVKKFIDTLEVKEEVTTIDAFIEEACSWFANRYQANGSYLCADDIEDFVKFMKGE